MKTREYTYMGQTYRWWWDGNVHYAVYHEQRANDQRWRQQDIPPAPAAASALAALIEDMQVQVIAEWVASNYVYRALATESGPVVEWRHAHADAWSTGDESTQLFRAGYEAGKAAR